jgi:uncharacterized protein (DUF1697 family)
MRRLIAVVDHRIRTHLQFPCPFHVVTSGPLGTLFHMARYAFLLRGINVGRAKSIAMAELRAALEADGFTDVRTLLRSGNVGATVELGAAAAGTRVGELVASAFGMDVGVVVRTHRQLASLVAADPLRDVVDDPSRYVVAFFSSAGGAELQVFADATEAPDACVARPHELVLWMPAGQVDSPAAKRLAKARFPGTLTARNWNTVTKLLTLLEP